mmetsp:Transcript_100886/g.323815  ORF Transcript_100886/g.323815 Transcript_100886/m.323815 type:complete len:212 (+) Transcript_100886:561-1196(+)
MREHLELGLVESIEAFSCLAEDQRHDGIICWARFRWQAVHHQHEIRRFQALCARQFLDLVSNVGMQRIHWVEGSRHVGQLRRAEVGDCASGLLRDLGEDLLVPQASGAECPSNIDEMLGPALDSLLHLARDALSDLVEEPLVMMPNCGEAPGDHAQASEAGLVREGHDGIDGSREERGRQIHHKLGLQSQLGKRPHRSGNLEGLEVLELLM